MRKLENPFHLFVTTIKLTRFVPFKFWHLIDLIIESMRSICAIICSMSVQRLHIVTSTPLTVGINSLWELKNKIKKLRAEDMNVIKKLFLGGAFLLSEKCQKFYDIVYVLCHPKYFCYVPEFYASHCTGILYTLKPNICKSNIRSLS